MRRAGHEAGFRRFAALAILGGLLVAAPPGPAPAQANSAEQEAAALMKSGADAIERGHYDKAAVEFSNALDSGGLTPEARALAWHHRGVALQKSGQQDAAIADYTRAIEARSLPQPVLARAHYNRGIAYGQSGKDDAAEQDYRKAIELSPGYAAAYHNLANLERRRGANDSAVTHYTAALEQMRGREQRLSYFGRALAYEGMGDRARAEADLRQALAVDPEFAPAAEKLTALTSMTGDDAQEEVTAKVLPSTVAPFQAASSGHEGAQIIRISSIGGWRTTATRLPREEEAPALVADAAQANDDIITGSIRPTDTLPAREPMALAKAETKPAAATMSDARYRIQLGAFREEGLAEQAWTEVSTAAAPVLGSAGHAIQRADLGEKGVFYRLQAGAYGQIGEAKAACKALERQKIACFVVDSDA